jgi:hypothetical protein
MSSAKTKSLLVKLPLSPDALAKFPHEPSSKSSDKPSTSPSTPAQIVEPTSLDAAGDAATSVNGVDNGLLAPPATDAQGKKKAAPRVSAGTKRGASAIEGGPKPRGKPGPKKKQRM